jgi:hypothetical protein
LARLPNFVGLVVADHEGQGANKRRPESAAGESSRANDLIPNLPSRAEKCEWVHSLAYLSLDYHENLKTQLRNASVPSGRRTNTQHDGIESDFQ